jgi:hypothetical protein
MGEDDGRQSGWYTVGGTLAAAGCTLFPLGLTSTQQSQTLQLLGLLAFVCGLAIIFYAMMGRRRVAHDTHPAASTTGKQSVSPRLQVAIIISASLTAIGVGSFFIIDRAHLQNNSGATMYAITADTDSYAGPSTQGYVVQGSVSVNTQVRVTCTVYGEPASPDVTDSLWDYTDHGWVDNRYVSTGTTKPTAPGCDGTTSNPSAGANLPTKSSGPYVVIAQEGAGVPLRAQPVLGSPAILELAAGTFVRIQCTIVKGPIIPAPRAIGSTGSDNVWDQIVDPDGWVPDSYVATYSKNPVAPPC